MKSKLLRKLRIALTPRSCLLRTRLENGAIVAGYNRLGYGGRGVYIFGDSLEPELASLREFLGPGSVFVDVGANIGVYTMKAAQEVGEQGLVIAVEPFMESAHQLSRNVRTNRFKNVRVRNFCMGLRTGPAQLYMNEGKPNSFGLIPEGSPETLPVLCVSLDDLCRWEEIDRLDYLKIDAEGAESMILEGGRTSIRSFRPIIQVEVTKGRAAVPNDYRRFSALDTPNQVFVPLEKKAAISAAERLGWIPQRD